MDGLEQEIKREKKQNMRNREIIETFRRLMIDLFELLYERINDKKYNQKIDEDEKIIDWIAEQLKYNEHSDY